MLQNQVNDLVETVIGLYVQFVTKTSIKFLSGVRSEEEALAHVVNNLESLIKYDFKTLAVSVVRPIVTERTFSMNETKIDYQEFAENYFQRGINEKISIFLQRFIMVIQDDLRDILLSVDNNMNNQILSTPLRYQHNFPSNNLKMDDDDLEKFRDCLELLGTDLQNLIIYKTKL